MVKIVVELLKNTEPNEKSKLLSFEKSSGFQHFMKLCSEKLGISAKRVYKGNGTEVTDLFSVDNNDVLYVSQGEEFMAKKTTYSMASDSIGEETKASPGKAVPTYKVVIMGSTGVGKSAITFRYTKKKFVSDYVPTIEDEHTTKLEIDAKLREISILDTAGSEQFIALRSNWMTKREAFILVFSIDSPNSFSELGNFFDQLVMVYPKRQHPIVLVANKIDLPSTKHQITEEQIKQKAEKWKVPYFEVSAKEDKNINEVFEYIVREVEKNRKPETLPPPSKKSFWEYCNLI